MTQTCNQLSLFFEVYNMWGELMYVNEFDECVTYVLENTDIWEMELTTDQAEHRLHTRRELGIFTIEGDV